MSNYSSLNPKFKSCLAQQGTSVSKCIPLPSSLNPYNVTTLSDMKMAMLEEVITNDFFQYNELGVCQAAANLLPTYFTAINITTTSPELLDLGSLSLRVFSQLTFPGSPVRLNETDPGQLMQWWWENVVNDTDGTKSLLQVIPSNCLNTICRNIPEVGDADITGVGVRGASLMATLA
jgi:hypothetical protein